MRPAIVAILFALSVAGVAASDATPTVAYPPIEDARDIWSRPWSLDGGFSITGDVDTIWVAEPERGYAIGEAGEMYRTVIVLVVPTSDGERKVVIGYQDDPEGVNAGDPVMVGGVLAGTYNGENQLGIVDSWPIIAADYVTEITDEATPAA